MTSRGKLVKRSKELQAAIESIENGAQSASISEGGGSKSYTRANLPALYTERTLVNRAIRKIDGKHNIIRRVGIQAQ